MTTERDPIRATSAEALEVIDAIRFDSIGAQRLLELLSEQSPVYAGRGTAQAERLRGYVLAAFEAVGLPPEAVPVVLEQLETGRNPYLVASAGRALRGAAETPPEAPELLVAAIERLRGSDDFVSFGAIAPAIGGRITCIEELIRTLVHLGPRAKRALPRLRHLVDEGPSSFSPVVLSALAAAVAALADAEESCEAGCCGDHDECCADAEPSRARTSTKRGFPAPELGARNLNELRSLPLQNQDGVGITFGQAFVGRATALAFFYTRCMNPEKCSLTVTKLARLASCVAADGLDANVAGISYDPAFDRPVRLRRYGADRGMLFTDRCSLLRTVGPFDPLQLQLDLGVGYGPVTVNQHRLDLFVLDPSLRITAAFERRLWDEEAVIGAIRSASRAVAHLREVEPLAH